MYKIFELSTHIATPLALAGFVITAVFFVIRGALSKSNQDANLTKLIVTGFLVFALLITIVGTAGFIWVQTGKTTIEGAVYHITAKNKKDILAEVSVSVIELRKVGYSDPYGRFSIPVTQEELRDSYTIRLQYKDFSGLYTVNKAEQDLNNLELIIYDTAMTPEATALVSVPVAGKDTSVTANATPKIADITLSYAGIKATLPTIPANLSYNDTIAYCEQVQLQLLINHNLLAQDPIRIISIGFENVEVDLSEPQLAEMKYARDADAIAGYGIVKVDEYMLTIDKNGTTRVKYIIDKNRARDINISNLLNKTGRPEAFDLDPQADKTLQEAINIKVAKKGLFKARFKIEYSIAGTTKTKYSQWIYIIKK